MSSQIKPTQLNFFITPAHACPYQSDKKARTLFLSPEVNTDSYLYSTLINQGFRRSGEHIYRPHCGDCKDCISVRVPTAEFKPGKGQKRTLKNSPLFYTEIVPARFNQQYYQLFDKYISTRHSDGDMYPTSPHQFREFLLSDWLECNFLNFYNIKDNKLVSTAVFDVVEDGLSAVYTFFDPDYARFSLGRLAILKLIKHAKANKLPYLYLGYWIKNSPKMDYKSEYRPIQCFVNQRWVQLN